MHQTHMIDKTKRRCYDQQIQVSDEDNERLDKLLSTLAPPKHGLAPGTVTRATDKEVWVDIGGKSEGVLSAEEFNLRGFGEKINVGDTVEVWVQTLNSDYLNDKEKCNISFAKAAQIRAWKHLEQSYKNRKLVDGFILSKTPGGYVISIMPLGARGFLPLSQADPQIARSNEILQKYKTQIHQFLIIRMERNWNLIVSRREAMFSESSQDTELSQGPKSPRVPGSYPAGGNQQSGGANQPGGAQTGNADETQTQPSTNKKYYDKKPRRNE